MSSEWKTYTLADVAFNGKEGLIDGPFGSALPADLYQPDGIPVIRGSNLSKGEVRFKGDDFVFVSEEVASRLARATCIPEDIVFTKKGTLGQVGIIPTDRYPAYLLSSNQMRLRVNKEVVLPDFAYYYLSQKESIEKIVRDSEHTGVPKINLAYLRSFPIVVPPISEQRHITTVLNILDDRIALLRETNATLEAMAQALFKSWFVDFDPVHANAGTRAATLPAELQALFPSTFTDTPQGPVPEGWRMGRIYDVATVTYGAPFASKQFNTEQRGQPLIRIRDLKDEKPGVYTEEVHPKGYLTQPGDVVVGMDGEFRAYLWGGEPAWLNQRVCVFKPKAGYSSAFVNYMIKPQLAAVEATEIATTVIHLGKNDIDRFVALIPSNSVLSAFSEVANPIFAQIVEGKQKAQTLANLRDTLLPRLISGQLRLPDEAATLAEMGV